MAKYQEPHKIDLEGLQAWKEEATLIFASSSRGQKRLYCTLNGTFQLEYKGEIIWQGIQPYNAVEAYNDPESILERKQQ